MADLIRMKPGVGLRGCVEEILIDCPLDGRAIAIAPYRVLPGPFPVIGFQYSGRLGVLYGPGEELLSRAGITGLQSSVRYFVPRPDTRSILVRMKPAGAVSLVGVPMNELAGAHVGLDALLSGAKVREIEERLAGAHSPAQQSDIVQRFLLDLLVRRRRDPHPAAVESADRILHARGNIRIGKLADSVNLTGRQIERLFQSHIGVGPKEFASLCRFDWAVQNIHAFRSWAELSGEAGYSDQADLIRSFSRRAGVTPGRFELERPDPH